LYRVRSRLLDGKQVVDETEIPLGLRWFRFDPNEGFILNGRRLQLQGTTWHQSYPGLGSALPNSRHFADMKLIRDMGCNFFRTSHYPHDPAVVDACDRLGLLVLEEMFVGEEVENSAEYLAIQSRGCEEMIRRDRNHPSVIMWGFEGEIDSARQHVEPVRALVRKLQELDPSRPATMQDARVEEVKQALDIVGLYSTFENDDRERAQHPERKYLIEEYTAAGIGRGIYGMGPQSEDLGCIEHEKFVAEVNQRRWIAGSALWHQFDYDGEEYDPVIPHVVTFGMADSWRIPKDVYYFYQSQWSASAMLHICGHWTWPGTEGKTRSVKVYSNAPEVELFLNGKSLGSKANVVAQALAYPPRIWKPTYEPGVLRAVARGSQGTLVDERRTAGPPTKLKLEATVTRVQSGNLEDLAELTASILDEAETVVPGSYLPVTFTLYGPGELLPQTWPGHPTGLTWNAIAGLTRILFRATERVGRAVVSAYSPGLELGRVEIEVFATERRDEMEYRSGAKVYQ
jgi:beta-galactosidase